MAYYTLLTTIGQAQLANAVALGKQIRLTEMALGDGSGAAVTPVQSQTALVREVYRAPLNQLTTDESNPNYVIAELVVPSESGGWTVREVGLYDDEGNLIAVGNFPETYKPALSEGASRDLVIRVIIEVSNTAAVTLKIDPTMVLASRQWVQNLAATETVRGVIALATQPEVDAGTRADVAVTPKKLRAGFAASLTQTGYVAFPSWLGGWILQWGRAANDIAGDITVTFPIAFPVSKFIELALPIVGSPSGWDVAISKGDIGKTQAIFSRRAGNGTTANAPSNFNIFWLALGK